LHRDAVKPAGSRQPTSGSEAGYATIVIEPTRGWSRLRLAELWRYRELIYFLTWRDIKVRYKQTVLGASWALIQPIATMVIFTLIFSRLAHIPSGGVPYPIFAFAALLPWTYFAYVLQQSGNSMLANASMISKVYFPRLALPLATAAAGLIDLGISLAALVVLMVLYRVHPDLRLIALPVFLALAVCTSLGAGLWLSALSVKYRDVKYVIPFLTQIWLFASPVAYGTDAVKGKLALVYAANPMVAVIDGFRWAIIGVGSGPTMKWAPSIVVTAVLLLSGLFYFRRMEQTFADVI
jgi:lipopolysaccharide transport system permease protein